MASRNVSILTAITGSNTQNYAWNFVAAYTAYNDNQNPQFVRTVTLTPTGILLTVGGNSSGIQMGDFTKAMAAINPSVTWAPVITVQPSNAVIGYGNNASFSMAATDELGSDISYQWKFGSNSANVPASGVYSNVTTNHLNISNSAGLSGVTYMCVATNPSGSNSTNSAYLITDPTIVTQPANVSVAHPVPASFFVVATGNSALNYQWQFSGNSANISGGVYTGGTTNTLGISNSTGLTGTSVKCVVTDSGGSQTSNAAVLTVT